MIKKWNQFNESMAEKPGPNVPGSVKITISDEEVNSFSDEPALSKLIYDDKASLLGNEVWYLENDDQTKAILDQYLEVPGKNELEEITESAEFETREEKIERIKELNAESLNSYNIDDYNIDELLAEVDDENILDEIISAMETLNINLFQVSY